MVMDRDPRAFPRQPQCDSASDSFGRAGHQNYAAFERAHVRYRPKTSTVGCPLVPNTSEFIPAASAMRCCPAL